MPCVSALKLTANYGIPEWCEDYRNMIQDAISLGPQKLQGRIRVALHSTLYSDNLQGLLTRRCNNQMGSHIAVTIFKTLTGGWHTSRRWQKPVAACVFCGESQGDSLQHYITCDMLWKAVSDAFYPFLPFFDSPSLLGVLPPSPYQLYGIHLAFHCYHSLRTVPFNSYAAIADVASSFSKRCT
eukprot:2569852-Karenia_brevis.AAC.1